MKKFLSVLLALAVAFTFTFGSTMSAFAAKDGSGNFIGYTVNEAKELVTSLGATATEGIEVNYTTAIKDADGNTLNSYTIPAASVQKGIDKKYADLYDSITADTLASDSNITVSGDYITYIFGIKMTGGAADKAAVKEYLEANPDAATYKKDDWAGYKAYLLGLVDSVDTSIYTSTEGTFTAKDNKVYKTSKEAAAADIALAKKTINEAEYGTYTYTSLYDEVFDVDDSEIIKVNTLTAKDPLDNGALKPASLEYVLANTTYKTVQEEQNEADSLASAKARAKADLSDAVIAYRTTDSDYNKNQENALAAYVTIKTYLIDAATTTGEVTAVGAGTAITKATEETVTAGSEVNAIALVDAAAQAEKDLANAKKEALAYGYLWDDVKAAKALQAYIVDLYEGDLGNQDLDDYIDDNDVVDMSLTAGQKAAAKIDYSDVEASAVYGIVGKAYTLATETDLTATEKNYYEAEWAEVKAIIDAYNAAVDAAKVGADIDTAEEVAKTAIAKVVEAQTISNAVQVNSTYDLAGAVASYFAMVKNAYNTNNGLTNADIYITWDGEAYDKGVSTTAEKANLYAWAIANGAKNAKEAYALLDSAKKVVDNYKTLDTLKSEAAAVVAQIAALPTTPALTDKAAVVEADTAYKALPADAAKYVTNSAKLVKALAAVEKLEAKAVATQIAALPLANKVTIADKAAVKAAKEAAKAYDETDYASHSYNTTAYNFDSALARIQGLEEDAIEDAVYDLYLKYQNNTLTAADADAVAAAKKAVDEYIAEYNTTPGTGLESILSSIDTVVAAAVAEAEWTTTDVKASLFDSSRKLTIWRTSKTSIRVTSVGSVADIKDHGYTVKYKFYKKAPGSSTYKLVKTTTSNKYTYTNLKKGTNKFQVKVCVYDADGKLVASKWTYYRAAKIK